MLTTVARPRPSPPDRIDLTHRDARLALGIDRTGWLIIALTRFDVLGPSFGSIPFGLTIPENRASHARTRSPDRRRPRRRHLSAVTASRFVGETQQWPGCVRAAWAECGSSGKTIDVPSTAVTRYKETVA
jgi:hypothetical protein